MRAPLLELPGGFSGRVAQPRKPEERRRVEEIFGVARLILGIAAVAAIYLSSFLALPVAPPAVRGLLLLYTGYALALSAIIRIAEPPTLALTRVIHAADLVWAAVLTAVTSGAGSPFFMLFLFALLGAAYRWGFRETLATGAVALTILAAEALWPRAAVVIDTWQIAHAHTATLLLRGAYLVMGALILGYMAEQERLRDAELAIGTAVLAAAQSHIGFRNALRRVAGELLCDFEAEDLLIVAKGDNGRAVAWHADRGCEPGGAGTVLRAERPGDLDYSFLDDRGDAWRVRRRRSSIDVVTLDESGGILSTTTAATPGSFWPAPAHRSAVVISLRFADEWNARVTVFFRRVLRVAETRVVRNVVCDIAPVMFNQYLLRRLRSRVAAAQRTRLARDLHDGVIQSLAGLEMQVGALRHTRRDAVAQAGIDGDLQRIQRQLAKDARSVRELMNDLRPLDIPKGHVNEAFAELVERFGRENGMRSRFTAVTPDVVMSNGVAHELGRTLQEALRNVRKHAHATRVDVTFGADNGDWKLVVSNDGRPFDFTGHRTLADLDAAHQGPRVIKERVRDIGGDLAIDSSPDRGVTLEVRIPRDRESHRDA